MSTAPPADPRSPYGPPTRVGTIRSADITEASGLAVSRCQQDVLWTQNDSGDDAFVYAMDHTGRSLGTWKVPGARNIDWEDIATSKDAAGRCYIYVAEIGDNKRQRHVHTIYRIPEPLVSPDAAEADRKRPMSTEPADAATFTYPDYDQNAETLLVHPQTGEMYVVTKRLSGPAGVYKLANDFSRDGATVAASLVAEISVPAIPNGLVTGGDISPDGKRAIICDYVAAYEWTLPDGVAFDDIWSQTPVTLDVGERKVGEAISYSVDGTAVFSTSEGRGAPIYETRLKK